VVKLGLDLLHLLADALRRVHDELLGGYCRQGAVPARRSGITLRRRLANLVGEQDRAGAHMDLGWLGGLARADGRNAGQAGHCDDRGGQPDAAVGYQPPH
jgi:hypothetical protein